MRLEKASMIEAKSVPALPIRYRTPTASSISRKACAVFSTASVLRVLIVIVCAPGYSIARLASRKKHTAEPPRLRPFGGAELSMRGAFNARRVRRKIAPRSRHDAPLHGPARLSRYARSRAHNPGGVRVAITSMACVASPALADSSAPNWRTIVLKGAAMPQLVGAPESHLEVLALHDGRLAPIPFQVDEVLPDGRYALPDGPEPLSRDSPGILDRDDEVTMML